MFLLEFIPLVTQGSRRISCCQRFVDRCYKSGSDITSKPSDL